LILAEASKASVWNRSSETIVFASWAKSAAQ
jgi:hypothetical protein